MSIDARTRHVIENIFGETDPDGALHQAFTHYWGESFTFTINDFLAMSDGQMYTL